MPHPASRDDQARAVGAVSIKKITSLINNPLKAGVVVSIKKRAAHYSLLRKRQRWYAEIMEPHPQGAALAGLFLPGGAALPGLQLFLHAKTRLANR